MSEDDKYDMEKNKHLSTTFDWYWKRCQHFGRKLITREKYEHPLWGTRIRYICPWCGEYTLNTIECSRCTMPITDKKEEVVEK